MKIFEIVGKFSVAVLIIIFILIILTIVLGLYSIKKNKLIMPRLLLFTLDNFYSQIKRISRIFGVSDKIIDLIGVEVRNKLNEKKFARIPVRDRIMVVPQCLRSLKCPARLDSKHGIECKECGLCIIRNLKKIAENLGYRFFIVPGGSFVERIVREIKPKAALGVACVHDLNEAMRNLARVGITVLGVPLIKEGCVETEVDFKKIIKAMTLGLNIKSINILKGGKCDSSCKNCSSQTTTSI